MYVKEYLNIFKHRLKLIKHYKEIYNDFKRFK